MTCPSPDHVHPRRSPVCPPPPVITLLEVIGEAPSGEQCMVAAAQLLPDLVVIDIDLPGMDGVETTSRLRARPSPPVVLLVSTCHEDAGAHFVPWCGAAAYLAKAAFAPDRLRAVWETASGRIAAPA